MRSIKIALTIVTLLFAHSIFAEESEMGPGGKLCAPVAKACIQAGYIRGEAPGKKFWIDCMKPTILGHEVKGVKIDPAVVKACRDNKIKEMQKELVELQQVK